MEDCIFCKIASNQIPSFKVWEDDYYLAFLDIHPIKKGHTLVVPKKHFSYVFEMEDGDMTKLFASCKDVASLLKKAYHPKSGKVGMMVYGLDVDHAHIHLVPLDRSGDLSFSHARVASKEELENSLSQVKMV